MVKLTGVCLLVGLIQWREDSDAGEVEELQQHRTWRSERSWVQAGGGGQAVVRQWPSCPEAGGAGTARASVRAEVAGGEEIQKARAHLCEHKQRLG